MSKIVSGTFISGGDAVNVNIGFVPDYVELYSALGGTELGFKFFKCLKDKETSGQYGLAIANAGDVSANASEAAGITTYEANTIKNLVPAPNGTGEAEATAPSTFVAGATAPTARTTSVVGTLVKPSTPTVLCTNVSLQPVFWGLSLPGRLFLVRQYPMERILGYAGKTRLSSRAVKALRLAQTLQRIRKYGCLKPNFTTEWMIWAMQTQTTQYSLVNQSGRSEKRFARFLLKI